MATRSALPVPLGVGCSVLPSRLDALDSVRHLVDLVEVSPDVMVREVPGARGSAPLLRLDRDVVDPVVSAVSGLPVIVHGLELSIGTAAGWNQNAVSLLDDFDRLVRYRWHSEHLGFLSAPTLDGRIRAAGVPLPLPFTSEAVDLVAARADLLARRTGRTFLLENAACYLPDLPADPGWDEATFLTELCRRSSCGLLLDLFNLHVNCVNFDLDPLGIIDRLPLERVVEVHVAGGAVHRGFLLDSHSALVPAEVWDLLDLVLDRAPHVAAVIFEVLDESFPEIGLDGYRGELEKLREHWDRALGRTASVTR